MTTDRRRTSWTVTELHAEAARRGAERRRKQGQPPSERRKRGAWTRSKR